MTRKFIHALTYVAMGALIVLSCQPVKAQSWETPNEAGGNIVLTMRTCADPSVPSLLAAYTFTQAGQVMTGCWAVIDSLIHIAWGQGQLRVLKPEIFRPVESEEPKTVRRQRLPTAQNL